MNEAISIANALAIVCVAGLDLILLTLGVALIAWAAGDRLKRGE